MVLFLAASHESIQATRNLPSCNIYCKLNPLLWTNILVEKKTSVFQCSFERCKNGVNDVEGVCWSIWKISPSSWVLKSHGSCHVLTGIRTLVYLFVLEIGPSSFLTSNFKVEVKMQFLADCNIAMAPSPLIRYSSPSEIWGLQFPG